MSRELITGLLITLLGLGLFAGGGYSLYTAYDAMASAEEVDAVVVDSRLDVLDNREDEDERFVPEVTYEYEYDGQAYTSDNVYPGWHEPGTSESAARSIVREYDEGETVTAYVNPDDQSESYLRERSVLVLREALGALAAGGIILIIVAMTAGSRILGVELPLSLAAEE